MELENQQWSFVDKSSWADGEWKQEPDKMQWTDEATGLPCLIHRGPSGALCGYVGVSESHPWFQVKYSHYCEGAKEGDVCPENEISVHGGLTFSDMCQGQADNGRGICHVPGEGEPDHVWWFGFDCAHSGDFYPSYDRPWESSDSYRNVEYVKRQCASLAEQLSAAAKP